MTREDIHEAAENDEEQDGVKPGGAGEPSEAGSGFGGESDLNGADAVPESTTGVNNPGTPKQ